MKIYEYKIECFNGATVTKGDTTNTTIEGELAFEVESYTLI